MRIQYNKRINDETDYVLQLQHWRSDGVNGECTGSNDDHSENWSKRWDSLAQHFNAETGLQNYADPAKTATKTEFKRGELPHHMTTLCICRFMKLGTAENDGVGKPLGTGCMTCLKRRG